MMKAVIYKRYGGPEQLKLVEVEKPMPAENEVQIRILASTVTPVDCAFLKGSPFVARLYTGLIRPKRGILGTELSGEIAAIGNGVTKYKIGDQVFASPPDGNGGHGQYICLPEDGAICAKPANLTISEAAALCNGGLTSLSFLRDSANISAGQSIMIIGASGSVGSFAVQLAKYFGAQVTAVCSQKNHAMVKSLGADQTLDYHHQDIFDGEARYDIIFDVVGKNSFSRSKKVLTAKGIYLSTMLTFKILKDMLFTARSSGKRAVFSATGMRSPADQANDMEFLKGLIEAGKLKTIIDKTYRLDEISEAFDYVMRGHKRGNVVISIDH